MTTFSNIKKMATAKSSTDEISVRGEFQIDSTNRVSNFNGQITGGAFNGYFNFSERPDGNISFHIDNVPLVSRADVENLIFATVADIHSEYDSEEE